jgi:hypothetical protein
MFVNVANGSGLSGPMRARVIARPRGMGAVVAVPVLVRRPPGRRPGLMVTRRGIAGLGSCSPLGYKYSNTPNGACLDSNTGSVVDCGASSCGAAAAPSGSGGASSVPVTTWINTPDIQPIDVGGFTGTINVPTLASALGDMLTAKETISEVNLLRAGVETPSSGLQDFAALAADHCGEYPTSQGCSNPQSVVTDFQSRWQAWLSQQAPNIQIPAQSLPGPALSPNPPSGSGSVPATVTFTNLTRASSGLQVGDTWRIDITGPPNSPVAVTSTQNGKSLGTTPMGKTDASGRYSLTASADASTVGDWREMWTVGTAAAPLLAFTVAAASAQTSGGGSSAGAPAGSGSGSGAGSGSGSTPPAAPATVPFSFLSSSLTLFGLQVPIWALAAVGAGLIFLPRGR